MELKNKFTLKTIQASEVSEVVRLVNSAYRGDSSKEGWTTEAAYLDGQRTDELTLLEEIKDPKKNLFCLRQENSNEIIGTVLLEKFQDSLGAGCYLGMLTVRPNLQNAGAGKWLMLEVERIVKSWNISRITLGVLNPREELMGWYERRGFHKNGVIEEFPYGQEQFGLPKIKDLHFVMFEKTI